MKLIKRNFLLDGGSILLETDNGYYLFNKCFSDSESLKNQWFLSNKNAEKVEPIEDENFKISLTELSDSLNSFKILKEKVHINPREIGNSEHIALEILKTTFENPKKLKVSWTL